MRIKNQYNLGNIFAIDETQVCLGMLGCTAISVRGEGCIPVRTTGFEKNQE